ncbi:putative peptide ABC transporter DppA [Kitasatospora phosalacinea]|uniref:Peptide ABC transporter DppA n=1 Tax=Kitasatospora phosalacinea TaxID=2065 RepID=A0A9W6V687_9ACTN|nr:ABC transporter substrate-binding protein [Kitasatospora phosalacinea]GLW73910.1 putative peptide ABC transporter DppA [Kitasatospora phosalacinea]
MHTPRHRPSPARPWSAPAVATALVLALSACGGTADGGGNSADQGPGTPGGTYTVALTEPNHLTPGQTTDSYAIQVIEGLFDTPVTLDPKDGHVLPLAAVSVESTDQRVWTVKLRPDGVFHNGEKVTAQSFADAWNAAAYGPNGWESNYYFAQIQGYADLNPGKDQQPKADKLSGLEVVDDTTLKVTLSSPFSQFPMMLAFTAFAPLPRAAFTDPKAFDAHPIGNGPFQMDGDWAHDQQIALKKAPSYAGSRKPMADGVTFKIFTSKDTAFTELQAGNVDVMTTVPAARAPEAKRSFGDRYSVRPSGTMDYLGLPLWDPRFKDPDLRRALSMAIDRPGVTRAIYNGVFQPADSIVAPMIPGHRDGACGEACTYDPAKAKALFDKAGGFSGPLELYFSNSDPTYEQWMTAVANQLKQNLGIQDVTFKKMASADLGPILNKRQGTGPYRQNWVIDYPSMQNYLDGLYNPDNRMGWSAPQFDALVARGNAAKDAADGLAAYQQAEDLALREMPLIPLWNWQDQSAWSDKVGHVLIDPYVTGLHLDQVTVRH